MLLKEQLAQANVQRPEVFTHIVHVVPAQSIEHQATLLYWDQATADLLGIKNPPGRVGLPSFDRWALKHLAFEVGNHPAHQKKLSPHNPHTFLVEHDFYQGAGRAGYFQIQNVWVNGKGIGRTYPHGPNGPPLERFRDHHDGALSIEEGIKETIFSRVISNEASRESSRVLAIIKMGRVFENERGENTDLVILFRTPLRRFDHSGNSPYAVAKSLAQLSAMKIFKGDFVNPSNMGSVGEIVDFDMMGHTVRYGQFESSLREQFLSEGQQFISQSIYLSMLGLHILLQAGLPHSYLYPYFPQTFQSHSVQLQRLARSFIKKAHLYCPQKTIVDHADTPLSHYLHDDPLTTNLVLSFLAALDFNEAPTDPFSQQAYALFQEILKPHALTQKQKEDLRSISLFKNRRILSLIHTDLLEKIDQLARSQRDQSIQDYIDHQSHISRLGTHSLFDQDLIYHEHSIYLRVFKAQDGWKLFRYPDKPALPFEHQLKAKISQDGGQSFQVIPGRITENRLGTFIQYSLEEVHLRRAEPFYPLQLFPYALDPHLFSKIWPLEEHFIEGPILFLNELLGLPASIPFEPSTMRSLYGISTSLIPDIDLRPASSLPEFDQLKYSFLNVMNDPYQSRTLKNILFRSFLTMDLSSFPKLVSIRSELLLEYLHNLSPIDRNPFDWSSPSFGDRLRLLWQLDDPEIKEKGLEQLLHELIPDGLFGHGRFHFLNGKSLSERLKLKLWNELFALGKIHGWSFEYDERQSARRCLQATLALSSF